MPCDPELADTAVFCEHYGQSLEDSVNTIVVKAKTGDERYRGLRAPRPDPPRREPLRAEAPRLAAGVLRLRRGDRAGDRHDDRRGHPPRIAAGPSPLGGLPRDGAERDHPRRRHPPLEDPRSRRPSSSSPPARRSSTASPSTPASSPPHLPGSASRDLHPSCPTPAERATTPHADHPCRGEHGQ